VSEHSPGKVETNEILLRAIYSPHQVEVDTGQLKPTALDDCTGKGLSTDRRHLTSMERMQEQITQKLQEPHAVRKGHQFVGVVVLDCHAARSLEDQGRRLFGVYDTALLSNPSHADVFQVKLGPKAGLAARSKLIGQLRNGTQPVSLHTAFDQSPPTRPSGNRIGNRRCKFSICGSSDAIYCRIFRRLICGRPWRRLLEIIAPSR
jgi:hypothetical protein